MLGKLDIYGQKRRRKQQPTPVLLPGKPRGQRSLVGHSPWGRKESDTTERLCFAFMGWASLVAQTVKNLPAMRETWVRSLGWEDLPEKGMATHSYSCQENSMEFSRGAWRAMVHRVTKNWTGVSD